MGAQADRQQTAMTSMATCIQAHTMGLMMEAGGPKGQDGNGRWPVAAGKPPHEHSKRTTNPSETGLRNVTDQRPPDGVQVKSGVGTSRVPRQDWTGQSAGREWQRGRGRERERGGGVCVCPRWWFASRDAATCKQQQSRCRQPAKSTMGRVVVVVDSRPTDYARMHLPEDNGGPWTGAG